MWPFKKKTSPRRAEARRINEAANQAAAWERFHHAGGMGSAILATMLLAGVVLLDVKPLDPFMYRQGQYISENIHPRIDFNVLDQQAMENAKRDAANSTAPVLKLNTKLTDDVVTTLTNLFKILKSSSSSQPATISEELRKQFALDSPGMIAAWQAVGDETKYNSQVDELKNALAKCYIVRPEDLTKQPTASFIKFNRTGTPGDGEPLRLRDPVTKARNPNIIELQEADKIEAKAASLSELFTVSPAIDPSIKSYLISMLKTRPTYNYDDAATLLDKEKAVREISVEPPKECFKTYTTAEVLVQKGLRDKDTASPQGRMVVEGLSHQELELLMVEHNEYSAAERKSSPWRMWLRMLGRACIILFVVLLLCGYVRRYHAIILQGHLRTAIIVILMLMILTVDKLMVYYLKWNPYTVIIPSLIGATIILIAYDQRFAMVFSLVVAVLTTMQLRADIDLLIIQMIGASVFVFLLGDIRTRTRVVVVSIWAGLLLAVAVWAKSFYMAIPWQFAVTDSMIAAGGAVLSGLLLQGFGIMIVERVFHVATSQTLLDWCDAAKPLLRRLAMEAPGTYNHSLQLATICENAAESIGARGLLARVGAYYHDIGKTNKPDYFVENQEGTLSRHKKLSPTMSLLIIISHVKDGLEMAREYGLPKILHEFIATHHGTTLVQYFYQQATERAKNADEPLPAETEFRYPGPKPQSKEAAILMLADASESSVRAMQERTLTRIENQVHNIIWRRLDDGQLDECDLTLSEVHKIEESLVRSLCSAYHGRIAYPTPPGAKPSAAETQPAVIATGEQKESNGTEPSDAKA